jgi:hypothetical protein
LCGTVAKPFWQTLAKPTTETAVCIISWTSSEHNLTGLGILHYINKKFRIASHCFALLVAFFHVVGEGDPQTEPLVSGIIFACFPIKVQSQK